MEWFCPDDAEVGLSTKSAHENTSLIVKGASGISVSICLNRLSWLGVQLPPSSFHRFTEFPKELQLTIWELAIQTAIEGSQEGTEEVSFFNLFDVGWNTETCPPILAAASGIESRWMIWPTQQWVRSDLANITNSAMLPRLISLGLLEKYFGNPLRAPQHAIQVGNVSRPNTWPENWQGPVEIWMARMKKIREHVKGRLGPGGVAFDPIIVDLDLDLQ